MIRTGMVLVEADLCATHACATGSCGACRCVRAGRSVVFEAVAARRACRGRTPRQRLLQA